MATWRRVVPFSSSGKTRRLPVTIFVAVLLVLVAGLIVIQRTLPALNGSAPPQVVLSSYPFPLTIGNNTLRMQLVDARGDAVTAEWVRFDARSQHPGSLPLSRTASATDEGVYSAMMTYSMVGEWDIDITAALADGTTLQEHYDVYVYPVPPANNNPRRTYISASEIATIPYNEAKELRIVIPLGTQAGIVGGHGDDVIGDEIRLNVSGRNTLIIQNDDISDHNVGPFFVRAGETVRQEFRNPATYQGACSIRHGAEVNIIVDA